ncbi:MAG: energy transducer TonB [Alphaproteobacteria bacterium]|nr:energy transducer TonB [Alphaproteobacteria bacterium]
MMRAVVKDFDFWGMGPEMKAPLTASVVFHFALMIFTMVGIPFVAREPLSLSTPPIMVEFVEIDKITQTNKPAPPAPRPEEKKPEEPTPPKPESKAAPDLLSPPPAEPPADAVPLPTPPEENLKKPVPLKKAPPAPKKPSPPKARAEEKPKTEAFQSLLKDLVAEPSPASKEEKKLNSEPAPTPEGQMAPLGERLTISEEDALRHQLAQCWNVMAGAKYAEDLVVEIRVTVNRDRTVNQATILDQGRYNRDTHYRAAADAALRALRNPRCSPLLLPPEKYEQWKVTTIRFDPREML